jgi:hypothetical protein
MVTYSKNAEWARPYVESVRFLVPLNKLRAVKGYVIAAGLSSSQEAAIIKKGNRYTITIKLENDGKTLHLEDLFVALAHELAHLVEWEHTPAHLRLMAEVLQVFANTAKVEGVRDTSRRLKTCRK